MKRTISFCTACALFVGMYAGNKDFTLKSPDGNLKIEIHQDEDSQWTISLNDSEHQLLSPSLIGFKGDNSTIYPSASSTVDISDVTKHRGVWKPVWGKRENVADEYNERSISFSGAGPDLTVTVRAYNDGMAFRYSVPEDASEGIKAEERTVYNFAGDYTAWFYNGENHNIGPEKLSESKGKRLPVMTIMVDENCYMAVHEADLRNGTPMELTSEQGETSFRISPAVTELTPGDMSAWRVVMYGKHPGALVDSHIIELLNPEPSGDFSWVKPGVAVWDWRADGAVWDGYTYRMSYDSWVRLVDFASEEGFCYLVLDANWYGPEHEAESNPLTGDKASDVRRIIQYAKGKGVGVWLYLNDVGGRKYPIEETLKQYSSWGAAGIKYGFMRGSQTEKNKWTQKITALCAENKLLVDFHDGPVHPYGQMRTWPNAVTREYCQAQLDGHKVFQPSTFVTSVFVNMLAGPIDMNNGMFDLRQGNTTRTDENKPVPSTLVSEAARTLIVFSGATIIPDIPEYYRSHPELLEFLSAQKMPWKESCTLAGEIGRYIVMMRQTSDAYLIGAATDENAREIDIPLDFLPKGTYTAKITEDGDDAHYLHNRETLKTSQRNVTRKDSLKVKLAPGGGACIILKKSN